MRVRTNAVVCQSIHLETTGKFILVGVVTGSVQTEGSDFDEEYCLFLNVSGLPTGSHSVDLKFMTPEGKSSLNKIDIQVPVDVAGVTLQITGIPFKTGVSGIFSLSWKLSSSAKWLKLIDIPVELSAEFSEDSESLFNSQENSVS